MTVDLLPAAVARCAPIIYLDEREPFPPLRVGYSVFDATAPSPSFQRVVEIEPPAVRAIEYAIWSDWDIGHLYELEHLWVYLDATDAVVQVEGSWHGFYNAFADDGAPLLEDGHPVAYSQPGKHAFAPVPDAFEPYRAETERLCTLEAGKGGLLVTHLYLAMLQKNVDDEQRIRRYLQARAFHPSWRFTRRVAVEPALLEPWPALDAYIPARVHWWLAELRAAAHTS